MVKKGKPKPQHIGEKKQKLLNAPTIALIALVIMVVSVIILPSANGGEEQAQPPPTESWVEQILANAPPVKMPMNDTEVQALLNKSRPVARFFYAPGDPASKQADAVLEELSENNSLVVDRINFLAHCGQAESPVKQQCPQQAPLTQLYLPNGQAFSYPGAIDKEKFLEYLSGNFTPTVRYYSGSCDRCPPIVNMLVEGLRGKAKVKEISGLEAKESGLQGYPAVMVDRPDLALQNYASLLNSFLSENPGLARAIQINDSIAILPNPHALFSEECSKTEIKFFFSPSMPTYWNESALLKGLQAQATSISIREECLSIDQQDADTCQRIYNQTTEPVEEAKKYALTSVPAYVINANCKYELVIQKPFSAYGENASAELRKQACSFGNC